MRHTDADGVTLICRWCGQPVTRIYHPDTRYADNSVALVAGAWFHVESDSRHCRSRTYLSTTTVAEPTQWSEVAGDG